MDKTLKKGLGIAVAGYLTVNVILHDEESHIHSETYHLDSSLLNTYTAVVSGASLVGSALPDHIVDLGVSPVASTQKIFGIKKKSK